MSSPRPTIQTISKYSRRVYGLGNLSKSGNGYLYRVVGKSHPHADARGRVLEHILIAEKALGRILPDGVQVHHVDHVRSNNKNRNLIICEDDAYHKLLHERERAYKATGDATAQTCGLCGGWMLLTDPNTYVYRRKNGRHISHHKSCKSSYDKARHGTRKALHGTP